MWESVLGCGGSKGRGTGGVREGKEKCEGVKKCGVMCGRVYGVSVESVGKCVEVWGG